MKKYFSVDEYKKHLAIALKAHGGQTTPHGLPYSYHILSVTAELINILPEEDLTFDEANVAIACCLLHDVLEDTDYDLESADIDLDVLDGVRALTKNESLPKDERMIDSINRLSKLPKYIQMVKLADRITNLDIPPPHWNRAKIKKYQEEAKLINNSLKSPSEKLNKILELKINEYSKYF